MLIAQITDLHAGWHSEAFGFTIDTDARLDRLVAHLNGLDPRPDLVLATGDLTRDGQRAEYEGLKAALDRLAMPVYLLPGNHDDRDQMRAVFTEHDYLPAEGFLSYTLEGNPLRIVALDTLVPGEVGGALGAAQRDWLAGTLAAEPARPTVIAMHHPPFKSGLYFFDDIGLRDGDAMGKIVARHPQIEAVLCGHVHREIALRWNGTLVAVTPSASYQYPLEMREREKLKPVDEPSACRLCLWRPGTGLVTHLSYIVA